MNGLNKTSSIWLLALLVGTILLFVGGPDAYSSRLFRALWDAGHLPFFILVSVWVWHFWLILVAKLRWRPLAMYGLFFMSLAVLALLTEIIQSKVGREFSWHDVFSDMTAAVSVFWWKWCFAVANREKRLQKGLLTVLMLGFVVVATFSLTKSMYDEWLSHRQFPMLARFESQSEMSRWLCGKRGARQQRQVFEGAWALAFDVRPKGYSGCSFRYFPRDWRGFRQLSFEIWSSTPNLKMTIRINDHQHHYNGHEYSDRFNRELVLHSGWNKVFVDLESVRKSPVKREMNMSTITNVGWFTTNLGHEERFYLDDVSLQ